MSAWVRLRVIEGETEVTQYEKIMVGKDGDLSRNRK